MTPDKRVLVGMSGGIDSTATCLMLREQGYTLRILPGTPEENAPLFDHETETILRPAA